MPDDRDIRRKRHRDAVPVEIDPELTPPPIDPSQLASWDSVPPPIKEQMLAMHGWAEKLYEYRNVGKQFDRIEAMLGTLGKSATRTETRLDDYVVPQIKATAAVAEQISRELPRLTDSVLLVTANVAALDKRVRDLEYNVRSHSEKFDGAQKTNAERIRFIEDQIAKRELRVRSLELDRDVGKAMAKTVRKRTSGIAGGVSAAVAAVITALVSVFR